MAMHCLRLAKTSILLVAACTPDNLMRACCHAAGLLERFLVQACK